MKKFYLLFVVIFSIIISFYIPLEARTPKDDVYNIVIVPGHDSESFGSEFRGLKEADINLLLAKKIHKLLEDDPLFEPVLVRDETGYLEPFVSYFENETEEIVTFKEENKEKMEQAIKDGQITRVEKIVHNTAPSKVSLKLNGINKWANEYDVELLLHIHFNDYARRFSRYAGEYSGFSIYIPETQFDNSKESLRVAENIFSRISKSFNPSDLPLEKEGIIESQSLIAIGSNNSLNVPSVLVEYGYIYEPQLHDIVVRDFVLDELAWQTYLGIKESFIDDFENTETNTSLVLDNFSKTLRRGVKIDKEVVALQKILKEEGLYYYFSGKEKKDCNIDGLFGKCTEAGLRLLQDLYLIKNERGFVGSKTREFLNNYVFKKEIVEDVTE